MTTLSGLELRLRLLCWWNGICYRHAEVKESDGYSWPHCQMCVSEGYRKRVEYKHERRMALIEQLRRHR